MKILISEQITFDNNKMHYPRCWYDIRVVPTVIFNNFYFCYNCIIFLEPVVVFRLLQQKLLYFLAITL